MEGDLQISEENFRNVMSRWPTGVSLITCMSVENKPVGILCNSLTSISVKRNLLMWTLDYDAGSFNVWDQVNNWAVHFLSSDQQFIIDRFATKGLANKFQGLKYTISPKNTPEIPDVVARLECTTEQLFESYDHRIIIGSVTTMCTTSQNPMIFLNKKFLGDFI
jgi:3-hydroxy-9,10-secoandrosta-1,3,5(10)-triene-9,17-dione monooxygenase reductase component